MESMKEVRNWLANKCKIQPTFGQPPKDQQSYGSVVTPQNIPEFIIPKSNSDGSSRRDSADKCSVDDDECSRNSISPPESRHNSPRHSPRTSFLGLSSTTTNCSRSAPTSPYKPAPSFKGMDMFSCEDLHTLKVKDTNADPQSMAAMSLPHFRTKTAYGFTTLNQAPHTRRKESLFHCESDLIPTLLTRRQSKKKTTSIEVKMPQDVTLSMSHSEPTFGPPDEDFPLSRRGSRRRETPTTVVTPVTILTGQRYSPETSPLPSPVTPGVSSPIRPQIGATLSPHHLSPEAANTSRCSRRNRLYYRRRSSLPGFEEDDLSSTDCSSAEASPVSRRKSNGTLLLPADMNLQKRHSSPCSTKENAIIECSVMALKLSCSCNDTSNARFQSHMLAEFGEVKLSFQYIEETKQFKVGLIKAENLGGRNKADQNINSYAKIYLMPGKVQRHTSDTVKRTRDPVYNQEFFFNDILLDELVSMKLRIKIFHKGHNFARHVFIGEIVIPLAKYNIQHEQRMWKDLEPKMDSEELGYLQASLTFDPKSGRLEVRIIQAKDLPKHHITGAPDPYVKVLVSLPGKPDMKKQTRIRKKTTQPMFKESFSFVISPKLEDLNYTAVTLTLFDHDRIRSDDVIGQVRLGYGSTEGTEMDQWNDALQNPGQEVTAWHYLMENEEDA